MTTFWVWLAVITVTAIGLIIGGFVNLCKKRKYSNDWATGIACFLLAAALIFLLFISPQGYAYRLEEQKVLAANPTCEILRKLDNGEWILLNNETKDVFKYTIKE